MKPVVGELQDCCIELDIMQISLVVVELQSLQNWVPGSSSQKGLMG